MIASGMMLLTRHATEPEASAVLAASMIWVVVLGIYLIYSSAAPEPAEEPVHNGVPTARYAWK